MPRIASKFISQLLIATCRTRARKRARSGRRPWLKQQRSDLSSSSPKSCVCPTLLGDLSQVSLLFPAPDACDGVTRKIMPICCRPPPGGIRLSPPPQLAPHQRASQAVIDQEIEVLDQGDQRALERAGLLGRVRNHWAHLLPLEPVVSQRVHQVNHQ